MGLLAAPGDQERQGWLFCADGAQRAASSSAVRASSAQLVGPVEPARAPPLGEQWVNGDRSAGGLVHGRCPSWGHR